MASHLAPASRCLCELFCNALAYHAAAWRGASECRSPGHVADSLAWAMEALSGTFSPHNAVVALQNANVSLPPHTCMVELQFRVLTLGWVHTRA